MAFLFFSSGQHMLGLLRLWYNTGTGCTAYVGGWWLSCMQGTDDPFDRRRFYLSRSKGCNLRNFVRGHHAVNVHSRIALALWMSEVVNRQKKGK